MTSKIMKDQGATKLARPHHRTVNRIATILDLAARSTDGLTLSDLADRLDAPVSSIQSLVNGLVASGYLIDNRRRFVLGLAPYLLNLVAGRRPVRTVTDDDLDRLARSARQSVVLGVRIGDHVFYLHRTGPLAFPRLAYIADQHVPRPLIVTAAGRLFLAHMEDRDRHARLAAAAVNHPAEVDSFLGELEAIRQSGIARGTDIFGPEVSCLAAPIFEDGVLRATVTVAGPAAEVNQQRRRLERILRDHTHRWLERQRMV